MKKILSAKNIIFKIYVLTGAKFGGGGGTIPTPPPLGIGGIPPGLN